MQGSAVTAWTFGSVVREETGPVFARGGVVSDGVGYATQMACFPFGQIMEKVAGVFGERRLKALLLPADGEPLGPPVRVIAEALLPL